MAISAHYSWPRAQSTLCKHFFVKKKLHDARLRLSERSVTHRSASIGALVVFSVKLAETNK
jgi:hypothetical protein